jgi:hypothetical protein
MDSSLVRYSNTLVLNQSRLQEGYVSPALAQAETSPELQDLQSHPTLDILDRVSLNRRWRVPG